MYTVNPHNPRANGITLIGMPGAGKSTVGILLSKHLGMGFVDSDVAIQVREQCLLQEIVDHRGYLALRAIEEEVLCALDPTGQVLATGGSAVYSERAMTHLATTSLIVYLRASAAALRERIQDYDTRGIARRPGQSFVNLFIERTALYERHAQFTLDVDTISAEQAALQIADQVRQARR